MAIGQSLLLSFEYNAIGKKSSSLYVGTEGQNFSFRSLLFEDISVKKLQIFSYAT